MLGYAAYVVFWCWLDDDDQHFVVSTLTLSLIRLYFHSRPHCLRLVWGCLSLFWADFQNPSELTAVDSDHLCAGGGGWLLIEEWEQLGAFPSQPIRVWRRPFCGKWHPGGAHPHSESVPENLCPSRCQPESLVWVRESEHEPSWSSLVWCCSWLMSGHSTKEMDTIGYRLAKLSEIWESCAHRDVSQPQHLRLHVYNSDALC